MVTKIIRVKGSKDSILYNENKVAAGIAKCVFAGNFLKDAEALSLIEKLQRFDDLLALNRRAECRAFHIMISFAPGDVLSGDTMTDIACEFMDRIGYGGQPFIVYLHFDTAIAHLHIVSTPIQPDGTSLNKTLLFRYRSEPARKALEEKYGLVKARRQKGHPVLRPKTQPVEKLQYGKRSSIRAITNILEYVLGQFHYRSFSDLNAILRWYNLTANPGKPDSRTHRQGGLLYHALDENGQHIGAPVKASSIYFKPGLKWLNARFEANTPLDPAAIWRIRSVLDAAFRQQPGSWPAFVDALRVEQMAVSPRFGAGKFPEDLSLIDWEGKMVINAGELGKGYSAKEIWQRLGLDPHLQPILLLLSEVAARTKRQQSLIPSSGPNARQPSQSRDETPHIQKKINKSQKL